MHHHGRGGLRALPLSGALERVGEVVDGRFELLEPLGKGAFASVWRAADRADGGRVVALKLLLEQHASDEKKLKRFVQEAKILERLEHPNVARSIAWSAAPGGAYLAMELVDGETLDARLREHAERRSPLPREGVAWICDQLASAVSYAHARSIVHRDLKPRNVMISRRGQRPFLKVLDFGIAKILLGSELDPTTVGKVLGSVLYIAPEQVLGRPVDHRADVFSLGTIVFEVLTLHRAWARDAGGLPLSWAKRLEDGENNTQISVLRRIARDPRPRPSALRPDLPPAVDEVLAHAMAIDPAARFASAEAFGTELRLALFGAAPAPGRSASGAKAPGAMEQAALAEKLGALERPAAAAELGAGEAPGASTATGVDAPAAERPRALPSFKAPRDGAPRAALVAAAVSYDDTADTLRAPLPADPRPTEALPMDPRPMDPRPTEALPPRAPAPGPSEPLPPELADTYRRPRAGPRLALWGAVLFAGAAAITLAAWLYLRT